ncbi:MAG: serine/threonine-protein kinase [Candidatus Woesearchaeota archaeon]
MGEGDAIKEMIGSVLESDFDIKKIHGEGGFSHSLLVENKNLMRLEDIKILKLDDPIAKERFEREAKILAGMKHKNIAVIYDIVKKRDNIFIRSQHIENGVSLKKILDSYHSKGKTIPEKIALKIFKEIIKALKHAHEKNILHLDIKPDNIIISSDKKFKKESVSSYFDDVSPSQVSAYLIDFGIAKLKREGSDIDDLSVFKSLGTTPYLAPEQVGWGKGHFKLNDKTDQYQAFLVLYEMISGEQAFGKENGISDKEIIRLKKKRKVVIPPDTSVNLNKSIKRLIEKGISRNPKDRFDSEDQVIKDLGLIELRKKVKIAGLAIIIFFFLINAFYLGKIFWDEYNSVGAIASRIERRGIDLSENQRMAEKLYSGIVKQKIIKPLEKGVFSGANGELLFPVYLDKEGNWVFLEEDSDDIGYFVNILFTVAEDFPEVLPYAIEYADKIYYMDVDEGSVSMKYYYALAPAYEITGDIKYLDKLVEVAYNTIFLLDNFRVNVTGTEDMYTVEFLVWLYDETGNITYFSYAKEKLDKFNEMNIEDDAYMYESVIARQDIMNQMGLDEPMKNNIATKNILLKDSSHSGVRKGGAVILTDKSLKNYSSVFTRDYLQAAYANHLVYEKTKNKSYSNKAIELNNKILEQPEIPYLFAFSYGEKTTSKDTTAAARLLLLIPEIYADNDNYSEYVLSKKIILEKLLSDHVGEKENAILNDAYWVFPRASGKKTSHTLADMYFIKEIRNLAAP